MRGEWLFRGAVIISLAAHGVLLAFRAHDENLAERIIRIPVILEADSPPPPPPPKPEEPPKMKTKPSSLAKRIKEVVEGDGLRTGELVDAEVGNYEEAEPPLPPVAEPPPPPLPKTKLEAPSKVDKAGLARAFLSELRSELSNRKKYPLSAQRMGVTGAVTVSFVVAPDSSFTNIVVKRSSGHEILDKAAVVTVRELSGTLERPKDLGPINLKTSVVLKYEING